MRGMTLSEIDQVSGGYSMYSPRMVLVGTLAGIVGGAIAVAGLGTPISMAGVALAAEGASAVAIGLIDTGGSASADAGGGGGGMYSDDSIERD